MNDSPNGRVIGIGGVFFKSKDPARLAAWYSEHLGFDVQDWQHCHGAAFPVAQQPEHNVNIFSVFGQDTEYFGDGGQAFMLNLVVDDLDALMARLKAAGATVDDSGEDSDYGKFRWVIDPDGNRVELWQPPATMPEA